MLENEIQHPAKEQFRMSPLMKIGYVSLNVSDIQSSLDFYQSILGLSVVGRPSSDIALLSADGSQSPHLLELRRAEHTEVIPRPKRAGLYHFAILLPERKYLADMLNQLNDNRDRVYLDGMADHLVSEALYIRDPDFNGIEIYRDRPQSEWKWNGNNLEMATYRLDTDDLLKESTSNGWKKMPSGTTIGHVHLHVLNLARALKFYHEILGLNLTTTYPGANFFAAGKYHHHIATNTWLGNNIQPASSEHVGLNHFGIKLSDRQEFERTASRLGQYTVKVPQYEQSKEPEGIFLRDTDGITIRLYLE